MLFYLSSDTLVYTAKPILEKLFATQDSSVKILFPFSFDENAEGAFRELFPNENERIVSLREVFFGHYSKFICANDWSPEVKLLIYLMRKKKVVTYSIQESVVDVSSGSDKYLHADVVFVQGKAFADLLNRNGLIVTGNPRYESITNSGNNKHSNVAFINCNFTYGVYDDIRQQWINDVVTACSEIDLDYVISKHPRDLSKVESEKIIESGAKIVHSNLEKSKILITRFSSLIHESIILGTPVIYYNPHSESMGYDFCFDNKIVFEAKDINELKVCIRNIISSSINDFDNSDYLNYHLNGLLYQQASNIILNCLLNDEKVACKSKTKIGIVNNLYLVAKSFIYNKLAEKL